MWCGTLSWSLQACFLICRERGLGLRGSEDLPSINCPRDRSCTDCSQSWRQWGRAAWLAACEDVWIQGLSAYGGPGHTPAYMHLL